MPLGDEEVMNLVEAARFLKVNRNTLLKYVQEGSIPAQKIGRQWRFSRRALLKWLESGSVKREE